MKDIVNASAQGGRNEEVGIGPISDYGFIGKRVIVRGDHSGVFFGTLKEKNGQEVVLTECRRLWYWDGAASISQLAVDGTTNPSECKFTVVVDEIAILDAIEIIPCTPKAIESIESVHVWKL